MYPLLKNSIDCSYINITIKVTYRFIKLKVKCCSIINQFLISKGEFSAREF